MNTTTFRPEDIKKKKSKRKKLLALLVVLWISVVLLAAVLGIVLLRQNYDYEDAPAEDMVVLYQPSDNGVTGKVTKVPVGKAAEMTSPSLPEDVRWYTQEVMYMYHPNPGVEKRVVSLAEAERYALDDWREYPCVKVDNGREQRIIRKSELASYLADENEGWKEVKY